MDILWLSANKFGFELLEEAVKIKGINIKAIVTLSGNAMTVMYDGIDREKWREFGIDVFEVERLNDEQELIRRLSPDFMVSCGWRQIISNEILSIPKHGIIGFHPTLLPKGRGPAPIINSILSGFRESGVTLYHLTEGLDDGDIIGQEVFEIADADHAEEVYMKAIESGRKIVRKYFPMLASGTAPRRPQDNSKATMFKKLELNDNQIDLEKEPAEKIYRKIKALSKPYRGAYIQKNGKKMILWRAELEK